MPGLHVGYMDLTTCNLIPLGDASLARCWRAAQTLGISAQQGCCQASDGQELEPGKDAMNTTAIGPG